MALLEMTGVSKTFGGVQALRGVDFTVSAGQIHGLAGENGAGESTMMKVIAGVYSADAGRMRVDGKDVHFRSSRDALAAGIGMVHQELSVAPELSVAEKSSSDLSRSIASASSPGGGWPRAPPRN